MEDERPSETAILAAIVRAAHPLVDSKPWIFEDNFAAAFAGLDSDAAVLTAHSAVEQEFARFSTPAIAQHWMAGVRAAQMARTRYAEDELRKALERGVSQYVMVGAGLESFAYRQLDLMSELQVFEIDHPASQRKKQARLSELRIDVSPHLHFVPVNLEKTSLRDGLRGTAFRPDQPAFFSWFGVIWYLTEPAVRQTLSDVVACAKGSEIVFDYVVPGTHLDEKERLVLPMIEAVAAAHGEPSRSNFEPGRMIALLKDVGFTQVLDLAPEDVNALYMNDRADGLGISPVVHLVKARV
jgi:methyltransferase (TIGR00027 family)